MPSLHIFILICLVVLSPIVHLKPIDGGVVEFGSVVGRGLVKRNVGRDCTVSILVDRYFLNTFGTNSANELFNASRAEVLDMMTQVNMFYTKKVGVGMPVVEYKAIDGSMDTTSASSLDLLEKFRSYMSSKGGGTSCVNILLTYQNFGTTLGYSYVGGVCSTDYHNVGVVGAQYKGLKLPRDETVQLIVHELGHLLGAQHDDQKPDSTCATGSTIMKKTIELGKNANDMQISQCSRDAFEQTLSQANKISCMKSRGTVGYMQYNNNVPII